MQKTVNPNASDKTRQLLNMLSEITGKSIITGQHTQTNPMEEIEYIKEVTGKEPKLRGFELLAYSPNINYEDVSTLQKTHIPWAYYMTWSKEFCIGEQYNRKESIKAMYESDYAVTM